MKMSSVLNTIFQNTGDMKRVQEVKKTFGLPTS